MKSELGTGEINQKTFLLTLRFCKQQINCLRGGYSKNKRKKSYLRRMGQIYAALLGYKRYFVVFIPF